MNFLLTKYFNFLKTKQSQVLSCANHCIETKDPIKSLTDWFKKNSTDKNLPKCLVEYEYE